MTDPEQTGSDREDATVRVTLMPSDRDVKTRLLGPGEDMDIRTDRVLVEVLDDVE